MATVVFFHAHPDDEAIATGGTMASLADGGHRVVLVTATAGELGEAPDGLLDDGESLVDRRGKELAEACRILGVERHVGLGFRDSGMAGEETNRDPAAFAATDTEQAAHLLADLLVEEGAHVLVIYDEHGVYDHPDHIKVHEVGRRASDLAGTAVLYLATLDRDRVVALASASDRQLAESPHELDTMGVPGWRITTEVDVRPWIDRKRAAMAAHASQIAPDSFFLDMPPEVFSEVWGLEAYIRVRPEPARDVPTGRETSLVLAAGGPGADADSAEQVAERGS